jgi:hypothetical protein
VDCGAWRCPGPRPAPRGSRHRWAPDHCRPGSPRPNLEGIIDLATGSETAFPDEWDTTWAAPQAWSPDGTTLAVLTEPAAAPGMNLNTLNVRTGAIAEIARLSARSALPGWTAAFSPDNSWLAFQTDDGVRIHALTSAAATAPPIPSGTRAADGDVDKPLPSGTRAAGGGDVEPPIPGGGRLAGKGAWTRDGRGLLVVSAESCECGDQPVRWTITTIAVADGAVAGPSYRVDGAHAVRVLGWWPSGHPVVAEYEAAWNAEPALPADGRYWNGPRDLSKSAAVRLIEAGTSRVLFAGEDRPFGGDVESVDVPDAVLAAGRLRPGDPPAFGVDTVLVAVLATAAVAALFLVAVAVARVSALRRRT